jgi:hypothetical protein
VTESSPESNLYDMGEAAAYTAEEEARLREMWRTNGEATCPRCGVAMRARGITGGSFGLGYRRRRQWLLCPNCKRSILFDAERGTRT